MATHAPLMDTIETSCREMYMRSWFWQSIQYQNNDHMGALGRRGVTLLELMVVVIIVGILAAVAIPAYTSYVTRSRRADAFTALETVRAAQEMYRAEYGGYATGFADLAGCSATMAGSNYTVSVNRTSTTAYTSDATRQGRQASDTYNFRIDQDGTQWYNDGAWKNDRKWEELR